MVVAAAEAEVAVEEAAVEAEVEVPDDIWKANISHTSTPKCKTPNSRKG